MLLYNVTLHASPSLPLSLSLSLSLFLSGRSCSAELVRQATALNTGAAIAASRVRTCEINGRLERLGELPLKSRSSCDVLMQLSRPSKLYTTASGDQGTRQAHSPSQAALNDCLCQATKKSHRQTLYNLNALEQ